jgi:catechol 2,3-dioxygenase-like lactoylglutathione lyase family enzyme
MPLAVHHLAVVTADLARSVAFYTEVLGLPVERRWADERGEPRSVWVALDAGAFLAIERASAPGPKRDESAPGFHCVSLRIARSERDAWRDRLEGAGCEIVQETAYTLYVRDPDGNLVGLSHWPTA